jgi:hypothetical protein
VGFDDWLVRGTLIWATREIAPSPPVGFGDGKTELNVLTSLSDIAA